MSVNSEKSIFLKPLNIVRPIMIRAGAVAAFGIIKANGVISKVRKKNTAAEIAVNPVLPPASADADDSINAVEAGIPNHGPIVAAIESTTKGREIFSIFPFSSNNPASAPIASVVPMVERTLRQRR